MMEQRSIEWHEIRLGKVTASRVADVVAQTKTGWGASRANYAAELVAERLTGKAADRFSSAAMQWGTDTEPQARSAYSFFCDQAVLEVGFVEHPTITMAGASPDGLVGDDGLVEIKCPNTATHIATLLGSPIDDKYNKQMQWQMACTGRKWCDFASFDPRLPVEMQLHVTRVARDDEFIADLEAKVKDFLSEIAITVGQLETKYLPMPVLAAG